MPNKGKTDPRIERTREALREALFELVREQTWSKISVGVICHRAEVARSSFYLHYASKLKLLDDLFQVGLERLRVEVAAREIEEGELATMSWLTDHLHGQQDFFQSGPGNDRMVFERFTKVVAVLLEEELKRRNSTVSSQARSFIIGGTFAILDDWLQSGCTGPRKDIYERLGRFANAVLESET